MLSITKISRLHSVLYYRWHLCISNFKSFSLPDRLVMPSSTSICRSYHLLLHFSHELRTPKDFGWAFKHKSHVCVHFTSFPRFKTCLLASGFPFPVTGWSPSYFRLSFPICSHVFYKFCGLSSCF